MESSGLENPLATTDQRETEDRALRLIERDEFARARAIAAHRWGNAVPSLTTYQPMSPRALSRRT